MTQPTTVPATPLGPSLWSAFLPLLPYMLAVFVGYLAVGMALPVIPKHVHETLGQGPVVVGVVMGAQFVSSFFARMWAGATADARGPRRAMLIGLLLASGTGLIYLGAAFFTPQPQVAVVLLVIARLLTGIAEAFIITGSLAWGVARVGPAHAGKVLGWVGVALFAALGAGAPLGVAVQERFGFAGVAWVVVLLPLLVFAATRLVPTITPPAVARPGMLKVIGTVKLPGLGLMLCASGYGMLLAFPVLLFAERGWGSGALAVTSMGAGFILARLLLGHLPDQAGGARVALFCLLAEALGLLLLWGAPTMAIACAGAALAGGGYSIGFQGFGVEAVRRAPPQSRGAAMGAYVAFQDIALGLGSPLGGLLAHAAGVGSVYFAAALAALGAAGVAWMMMQRPTTL